MHLIIFFRDSKRKLEELLHQWSEWHARYVSSSNVIVTLLYSCIYCHTIIVFSLDKLFQAHSSYLCWVRPMGLIDEYKNKKKGGPKGSGPWKAIEFLIASYPSVTISILLVLLKWCPRWAPQGTAVTDYYSLSLYAHIIESFDLVWRVQTSDLPFFNHLATYGLQSIHLPRVWISGYLILTEHLIENSKYWYL